MAMYCIIMQPSQALRETVSRASSSCNSAMYCDKLVHVCSCRVHVYGHCMFALYSGRERERERKKKEREREKEREIEREDKR